MCTRGFSEIVEMSLPTLGMLTDVVLIFVLTFRFAYHSMTSV